MIQPRAPTIEILPVDDAIPGRLSQTKMMADLYIIHIDNHSKNGNAQRIERNGSHGKNIEIIHV
jgi:hypothetical protein